LVQVSPLTLKLVEVYLGRDHRTMLMEVCLDKYHRTVLEEASLAHNKHSLKVFQAAYSDLLTTMRT
jgi:hypothetical protein